MSAAKPTATVTLSTVRKTYWLDLDGCETRPVPNSRTDRRYRPLRMQVDCTNGNVRRVELSGAVIKKDGSDGNQTASERLWRTNQWPHWVKSIVGGLA